MEQFCKECGTKLIKRELDREGQVPYCTQCGQYRFPQYNVAVSMIVRNHANGKILLIQQYGKHRNILVAGYVSPGESLEDACARELKEETNLTAKDIAYNRSKFYEPSGTLMCNFTVTVADDTDLHCNEEIDSFAWFTPDEAKASIAPGSLAEEFLVKYLKEEQE